MSEEEALAVFKMQEAVGLSHGDQEAGHAMADEILCEFLRQQGFFNLAAEYDKLKAW